MCSNQQLKVILGNGTMQIVNQMENPQTQSSATILVADDEPLNREIISEYLEDQDYTLVMAEDGAIAWDLLEKDPGKFDAVLLDRMMPNMDGMEVLARIKAHPTLQALPVIIQTARTAKEDILEGLQAGAYYYLTKPFEQEMLLSIVHTAVTDHGHYRILQKEIRQSARTLGLMQSGRFNFRTLDEGRNLAAMLANACPEPDKTIFGLSELFINAVEHGNLGITYEDKSELNKKGTWQTEVERRLGLPDNQSKFVDVHFERDDTQITISITDQGPGFAWEDYLEMDPKRAFDSHGRGITMAKAISFDSIEYQGKGNEVVAAIDLKGKRVRS